MGLDSVTCHPAAATVVKEWLACGVAYRPSRQHISIVIHVHLSSCVCDQRSAVPAMPTACLRRATSVITMSGTPPLALLRHLDANRLSSPRPTDEGNSTNV